MSWCAKLEFRGSADKLSEVRDMFDNFDSDKSGTIGSEEILDMIDMLGTKLNPAEFKAVSLTIVSTLLFACYRTLPGRRNTHVCCTMAHSIEKVSLPIRRWPKWTATARGRSTLKSSSSGGVDPTARISAQLPLSVAAAF